MTAGATLLTVDPIAVGSAVADFDNGSMRANRYLDLRRIAGRLGTVAVGLSLLALIPAESARARAPIAPAPGAETASAADATASLRPLSQRATAPMSSPIRSSSERVHASPATSVTEALRQAGVRSEDYGLVVRAVEGRGLALRHNAEVPFNPASTMKLVTTHAAMELLGVDYRWITGIYTTGVVDDGVLEGNLIIKGGGDPKLVIEDLTELVARLRGAGLRDIRGDLIIDDSIYGIGAERQPSFDGDDNQPYNVQPYGALMNFKATRFIVDPRSRQVRLDPPLADVRIDNQVRIVNGRCRRNVTGFTVEDISTESRAAVRLQGRMVRACGAQSFYAAALSHRQYVHGFFKAAWLDAGGTLRGSTRIVKGAARGEPYLVWQSPRTLVDVVRDVNKFSNNVMARMLVLQIGAERRGAGRVVAETAAAGKAPPLASVSDGRDVLRDWYRSRGLALPSLVIENGSGLSRTERISASDMSDILVDAAQGPNAWLFEDSLPQVGVDGTMRRRLRNDALVGHANIKTGTLRNVRAIAGYVTAASGVKYAVTLIVNGPKAEGAGKAQDALLRWVYQNG